MKNNKMKRRKFLTGGLYTLGGMLLFPQILKLSPNSKPELYKGKEYIKPGSIDLEYKNKLIDGVDYYSKVPRDLSGEFFHYLHVHKDHIKFNWERVDTPSFFNKNKGYEISVRSQLLRTNWDPNEVKEIIVTLTRGSWRNYLWEDYMSILMGNVTEELEARGKEDNIKKYYFYTLMSYPLDNRFNKEEGREGLIIRYHREI